MSAQRAYFMLIGLVTTSVGAVGCTDYPAAVAPYGNPYEYLRPPQREQGETTAPDRTTWHKDVRAIVEKNCVRCHNSNGVAPMSLESYEAAQPYVETMAAHVETGYMPPWGFDESCRELAMPRGLSTEEKATFADWSEAGFPAGSPNDYVAPAAPTAFDPAGEVEVRLTRGAYTPDGDEARCFLLDKKVSLDSTLDSRGWWVTDLRIDPDQTGLVQHATLYLLAPDETAAVPAGEQGYACELGAGTDGEVPLIAWVPGAAPTSFAQESALLVPYGSRFVLRLRYHASHLATPPADTTSATLWRYLGRRTPSAEKAQVRMWSVRASGREPAELFLPHSQSIFAVIPEMGPGGESLLFEYFVGPAGTCLAESKRWDERFPETLHFLDGRFTNARLGSRVRLSCSYEDGTIAPACRATIAGAFPLVDGLGPDVQPLGQTCSGVEGCLARCGGMTYCLLDCIAYELPECGQCAREQLFSETCASAIHAELVYANFASCVTSTCPIQGSFGEWLACLFADEACKTALGAMSSALEDGIVGGACNRPDESCIHMSPL